MQENRILYKCNWLVCLEMLRELIAIYPSSIEHVFPKLILLLLELVSDKAGKPYGHLAIISIAFLTLGITSN